MNSLLIDRKRAGTDWFQIEEHWPAVRGRLTARRRRRAARFLMSTTTVPPGRRGRLATEPLDRSEPATRRSEPATRRG